MTEFLSNKIMYWFLIAVIATGCFIFISHINFSTININWLIFSLLTFAIILSNHLYMPLTPKGNAISMDSSFHIATLFVFGLEESLLLLLVSSVIYSVSYRSLKWWKHVFNFSIYSVMICSAYHSYIMLNGLIGEIDLENISSYLLSLLIYFVVNILLMATFFYLATKKAFIPILRGFLKETIPNYFITLGSSYLLIVLLTDKHPVLGLIIFTFIIILLSSVFRKNFNLYEAIKEDKNYREQILNSLPIGIITINEQSSKIDLNDAATRLLNKNPSEISPILTRNITHESNLTFWENVATKENYNNIKADYTKEGKSHLFLMSQTELIDQYEKLIGRIIYFIDITETDELEKRINQSEKLALLGQLAAGAAHEIRNPLTVIQGFVSLMNVSLKDHERDKFQLPLLLKEFKRIDTIIDDMLLIAKPGAPILKEVCLESLVKEILPLFDSSVTNQDISFSVKMTNEKLMVDSKQITQVLYNIFRNSSEAIGQKGWIKIYSEVKDGMYQLFIEDNGPGIPKEFQKTIFDPFQTTKDTGTGLGLTIVQRIIENHQGKIELQSNEMGTIFIISLPVVDGNKNTR